MTPRIGWEDLERAYEATGDVLGPGASVPGYLEELGVDSEAFARFVVQCGAAAVAAGKRVDARPEDMVPVAFARAVMVGLELGREVFSS